MCGEPSFPRPVYLHPTIKETVRYVGGVGVFEVNRMRGGLEGGLCRIIKLNFQQLKHMTSRIKEMFHVHTFFLYCTMSEDKTPRVD